MKRCFLLSVTLALSGFIAITSAQIGLEQRHRYTEQIFRRNGQAAVPAPHPKAPIQKASTPVPVIAPVIAPAAVQTTSPPAVCGNGILEHGEECDCGSPQECVKDPCCNSKLCKLAPGAQCSNTQECCDKCQFRPSTFVCRAGTPECGMADTCTGKAGKCPPAKKECPKNHSITSSNNTDLCNGLTCSPRDLQCQSQSSSTSSFSAACTQDTSGCQISCVDSKGSSSCTVLSAYYSDGTECGSEGVCTNGACIGDKNKMSFFKRNTLIFAIGGASIVFALALCFVGVCCMRKRSKALKDKEKARDDAYPMTETKPGQERRRSNIRIGLDPIVTHSSGSIASFENPVGSSSAVSPQRSKNFLGRPSGNGSYAPDSLMSEHEMKEELEINMSKALNPSISLGWSSSLQGQSHNGHGGSVDPVTPYSSTTRSATHDHHTVYVPPPLPPSSISPSLSLTGSRPLCPYASDAMVLPSLPSASLSGTHTNNRNSSLSNTMASTNSLKAITTRAGEKLSHGHDPAADDDDEPSFLQLDNNSPNGRSRNGDSPNSLTIGRPTHKDRASVSSFFSTLAIDPEPESMGPPSPALVVSTGHIAHAEVLSTSDMYIIPAPVARKTPSARGSSNSPSLSPKPNHTITSTRALGTTTMATKTTTSPSKTKANMSELLKQEEMMVATSFAQDLGFEIVNPSSTSGSISSFSSSSSPSSFSPLTTTHLPVHKPAIPSASRRL